MKTLVLAPRYDDDSQLLWQEAVRLRRDWCVVRLDSYQVPRSLINGGLARDVAAIYGGHIWGRGVAQQLGVELLSPQPDWLCSIRSAFLKRSVFVSTLGSITFAMTAVTKNGTIRSPRYSKLFIKSLHWTLPLKSASLQFDRKV